MDQQKLPEALLAHQNSLQALESEIVTLMRSDVQQENRTLKERMVVMERHEQESRQKSAQLEAENQRLKSALSDQLFSERTHLVNRAEQKTQTFFRDANNFQMDRLRQLEMSVRQRIQLLRNTLHVKQEEKRVALMEEIDQFERHIRQELAEINQSYQAPAGAFTAEEQAQFEVLRQEPLTDQVIQEISRKNNLEVFIGQNLINKVGVLLVVIGVIAASQYTLLRLPDLFKGIAIFLLGALLLAGGELLSRRKANVFSLGITAGGVAVLYVGMAVSYFTLKIMGVYPAILICALITAAAFFLSRRYESQTIASFALIGGYLPILAIGGNLTMIYGAMAYFVALNLLALLLGSRSRWLVSTFIGFTLNLLGSIYLSGSAVFQLSGSSFGVWHFLLLCYLFFTFLIYTAVPIAGAYRRQSSFAASDIALLSINTLLSSVILYSAFYALNLSHLAGLLALLFAVCYLLLGRWIERRFTGQKDACVLFYLTGFAFVVLVVPFQFDKVWLSLGWLAEGMVLLLYGILKNKSLFRRVGAVIYGLCLLAFTAFDLTLYSWGIGDLFFWKYTAITISSLVIIVALIRAKEHLFTVSLCKLLSAINLWIYLLYISYQGISQIDSMRSGLFSTRLLICLWLGITVLLAYLLSHIKKVAEPSLQVFSLVLYSISCIGIFFTNFYQGTPPILFMPSAGSIALATTALVLANLVAVFSMRELLTRMVLGGQTNISLYPLLLSAFGLLLLSQVMIIQYQISFSSILISLIYMLTAVLWVIFGFSRRSTYLRRFGLGMSMLAVIKLFLLDLFSLTNGYRIVSYFALGIALIIISFIYQYFTKKFEPKETENTHE